MKRCNFHDKLVPVLLIIGVVGLLVSHRKVLSLIGFVYAMIKVA